MRRLGLLLAAAAALAVTERVQAFQSPLPRAQWGVRTLPLPAKERREGHDDHLHHRVHRIQQQLGALRIQRKADRELADDRFESYDRVFAAEGQNIGLTLQAVVKDATYELDRRAEQRAKDDAERAEQRAKDDAERAEQRAKEREERAEQRAKAVSSDMKKLVERMDKVETNLKELKWLVFAIGVVTVGAWSLTGPAWSAVLSVLKP